MLFHEMRIDDYLAATSGITPNKENTLPRIQVVTPTSGHAVALADMKTYLRIDGNTEDSAINALLDAATVQAESWTNRAFLQRDLKAWYDFTPTSDILKLVYSPVSAISKVVSYNTDDTETEMAASTYIADIISEPSRVALRSGSAWPTGLRRVNAFAVEYTAGYGAEADIPAGIKEGLKLLVAHYYEGKDAHKLASKNVQVGDAPPAVLASLLPFLIDPFNE